MPVETQLREIFEAFGDGVFIADASGGYLGVNPAGCAMLGYSRDELVRLSLAEVLDPSEWRRLPETIRILATGQLIRSEWLFRRKDGSTFVGELVGGRLPDGRFQSVVRDISERLERERHEQLLIREATHRTKNILSLVQAMARQTASHSPDTFLERFDQRIAALAASHDLFVNSAWGAVGIEDLVRAQLSSFAPRLEDRFRISGPEVQVTPAAAQSIGMALHELGTNAAKYGALSNARGRVSVDWTVDAEADPPRFTLAWREAGGPPVEAPARTGFGARMIAQMTRWALRARTELEFEPSGLWWRMECPLAAVVQPPAVEYDAMADAAGAAGERVLVVEADAQAAGELADAASAAGLTAVGTAATPGEVLARLDGDAFDGAIVALRALAADAPAVIGALRRAGKPVILLVDGDAEPGAELEATRVVRRPVTLGRLVSSLATLFEPSVRPPPRA